MGEQTTDRGVRDNEVVFRKANEQVQRGFRDLKTMAEADGHGSFRVTGDIPLHFYCECSDEDCRQRIVIDPTIYARLHKNRRQFVVLPGHEVVEIEKIIKITPAYNIVEKFQLPDESATELQSTDIDNTSD